MREIKKNKKKKTSIEKDTNVNKEIKKNSKIKETVKEEMVLETNDKKSKGTIFITIISILLFIASLSLGYVCLKYSDLKRNNNDLQDKINVIKDNILNVDNDYVTYSKELDDMKVLLKDKIEEYNIWLETIEKVK